METSSFRVVGNGNGNGNGNGIENIIGSGSGSGDDDQEDQDTVNNKKNENKYKNEDEDEKNSFNHREWIEMFDATSQSNYFINERTGESLWTLPDLEPISTEIPE